MHLEIFAVLLVCSVGLLIPYVFPGTMQLILQSHQYLVKYQESNTNIILMKLRLMFKGGAEGKHLLTRN